MQNILQLYLFDELDFCKKKIAVKNKNLIDDGFNSELVKNAIFDGFLKFLS